MCPYSDNSFSTGGLPPPALLALFLLLGYRFKFSGAFYLCHWLLAILLCQKVIFHAGCMVVVICKMISHECFLKLTIVLCEKNSALKFLNDRVFVSWRQLTLMWAKTSTLEYQG